jgi:hypothetical protein
MVSQIRHSRPLRYAAGLVVGLVLLWLTVARVDLPLVANVIATAALPSVLVAVAIVLVDLGLRALRWHALLRGIATGRAVSLRLALSYLTIGYLANLLLPARLGDVARAYLAGTAFRLPRLATLGTIVVERVADGATMLGLAVVSSLLVVGMTAIRELALYALLLSVAGLAVVGSGWLAMSRTPLGRTAAGRRARDVSVRLWSGVAALNGPRGAIVTGLLTLGATTTAVLVGWWVADAVGLALTPLEATLLISAIALSLAIPAAPAALGTYEFVGVTVLTAMGHDADRAFAAIVLLRMVAMLPPVVLGLFATWLLHLRPAALLEPEQGLAGSASPDSRAPA